MVGFLWRLRSTILRRMLKLDLPLPVKLIRLSFSGRRKVSPSHLIASPFDTPFSFITKSIVDHDSPDAKQWSLFFLR